MGIRGVIGPLLGLLLTGCGTASLFAEYDVPERPETETAPWPRLVDTPAAPPPGVYTPAVPDPAAGVALETDLGAAAQEARARAEVLAAPVLSEADYRRLGVAPPAR